MFGRVSSEMKLKPILNSEVFGVESGENLILLENLSGKREK